MTQLYDKYKNEVMPQLLESLDCGNAMEVPRLAKVTLNMGVGEAVADSKKIRSANADMMAIAGQKPVINKARKSIAGFKVREGMPLGVKVTLRRSKMYEFLDRLTNIALPRVTDFRGISSNSCDGRGNYALGPKEHIGCPEIEFDKVEAIWGMDIVVCTTAMSDNEAKSLLRMFNMPFIN